MIVLMVNKMKKLIKKIIKNKMNQDILMINNYKNGL